MDTTTIRKVKLNGSVHTWDATVVAEDEHGLWMFSPAGTRVHNAKDGEEWDSVMGDGSEPGFLWLAPRDEWWFGAWWTRGERRLTCVDACTVPSRVDGIWTWTDLELDVVRDETGHVWVEDEDEFDDSLAAGLIAPDAEAAARAVTGEIVRRLTERVQPFDGLGWRRHDELTA